MSDEVAPSSSEPPNIHEGLGSGDAARRLLWDGTLAEIERLGLTLQGELFHGATGVVFLAKDRSTGVKRAIKIYFDPSDDKALAMFQRELQVLCSDSVPSDILPQFFTAGGHAGLRLGEPRSVQPFLVLEYIDGQRIHDYVSRPRPLPVADRVVIVAEMLRTLQRFHDGNLVHGDVSSNNVLVQKGDRVRLIDVAQARRKAVGYQSMKSVSGKVGTAAFSPEALLAGEVQAGVWTDIRQAAAVAYHVLTSKLAAGSESTGSATWAAELARAGVSGSVAKIVLKGLRDRNPRFADDQPDPRLYPTAAAVADGLEAWVESLARRRRLMALAACAVLLLSPTLWLSWHFWQKYQTERAAYEVRQVAELQDQAAGLANRDHPALQKLFGDSDELKRAGDQAQTIGDEVAARKRLLERLETLRQIVETSGELARCGPLRENLTIVLVETPWTREAAPIRTLVDRLTKESEQIRQLLEQGKTREAASRLAAFHRQLAEGAKENALARRAADARRGFEAAAKLVPPRLAALPEYALIGERAQGAETVWNRGDWQAADLSFGQATQQLGAWIQANATAAELAQIKQATEETLVRLEQENGEFQAKVAELQKTIEDRQAQITELSTRYLAEQKKLEELGGELAGERKERKRVETDLAAAKTEAGGLKQQLKTADDALTKKKAELGDALGENGRLKDDRDRLAEAKQKLETERTETAEKLKDAQASLTKANADLANWKSKAQTAEKELATWKARPQTSDTPEGSKSSGDTTLVKFAPGKQARERRVVTIQGIELAWRWCPPGKFMMGSPKGEKDRSSDEDQKEVTLSRGFWALETEFTQGMWIAVMGNSKAEKWITGKGNDFPAYNVDWKEADECCKKLTVLLREQGLLPKDWEIRLPTEAEWEYMCRAGETARFSFGDDASKLGDYAWFSGNSGGTNHAVRGKKPNRWELHDVHGSVWEWTSDWYDAKLPGGTDPRGPSGGSYRVYRGGSWGNTPALLRSAFRDGDVPSCSDDDLGFRPLAAPVR
ncbi:MAG: SUMF1/EgtB/PvdO family nonheme iron enzyme [Planctomycetales bacterium]